jgi:hypothetical protein
MRKFFDLPILVVIATAAILIGWLVVSNQSVSPGQASSQTSSSRLQVSGSGGQIFTNVSGDSLQQATPPARSATSSDLNPQQAVPNYCTPGEDPTVDGCVSR